MILSYIFSLIVQNCNTPQYVSALRETKSYFVDGDEFGVYTSQKEGGGWEVCLLASTKKIRIFLVSLLYEMEENVHSSSSFRLGRL